LIYDSKKLQRLLGIADTDLITCPGCGQQKVFKPCCRMHHTLPRAQFPDHIYDISSIIILCTECHLRVHGKSTGKKFRIHPILKSGEYSIKILVARNCNQYVLITHDKNRYFVYDPELFSFFGCLGADSPNLQLHTRTRGDFTKVIGVDII
jgi:hypothetical protein